MSAARVVHEVDPARLAPGRWCHEREIEVGEGDIAGSYSADRIAMHNTVKKPFRWNGALYVSTGSFGPADRLIHEAYRLVDAAVFRGEATTYPEKTRDAESARKDPLGFYHGMAVRQGGRQWVMCGPPVAFKAGPSPQADLFAGVDHGRGR